MRFSDDTFTETCVNTIGVDFKFKTMNIDDRKVKFQIWDTAGQERFRTITNAYYKNAHAIVIVYDTTCESSYEEIEDYWLKEVQNYGDPGVELLLIGNKSDDVSNRQVEYQRGHNLAEKNNAMFFETSAKMGDNVNNAFVGMARNLMEKKRARRHKKRNKDLGTTQLDMESSYVGDDDGDKEDEELSLGDKIAQKTNEWKEQCCN